ncbi:ABC transporter permease [Streptomyces sp. NPDC056452]|uniref:ABC transporter permease n=1 Tax=Streptomyces sp. NPDC056452 TaxID=3345821 RepID=UPI003687B99A
MKLLLLLGATFSLSLRRTLTHRVNFVFDLAQSIVGIGTVLATTLVIFDRTGALAGWTRPEMFVLIGVFALVSGIRAALIDPSLTKFVGTIRDGTLDEALLRPAPSWFTATNREHAPLALGQAFLGVGILVAGVGGLPAAPGPVNTVVAVILTGCAVAISWAISVMVASLGFWAGRFELAPLTASLWDVGRYPAGVYGSHLRSIVTYVIPLAGMITLPAEALTRPDPLVALPVGLAVTACFVLLSMIMFSQGVKRYTGATS